MKTKIRTKEAKRRKVKGQWSNKLYVKLYQAALESTEDKTVAATCGISYSMLNYHKKNKSTVRWLLKEARKKRGKTGVDNVLDFVYDRLSNEHKVIYDEICQLGKKGVKNGYEQARKLMENKGEAAQKQMFLYSLIHCNFNQSKARKRCCVTLKQVQKWMNEPEFADFLEEVNQGFKDFLQGALVQAVQDGDTQAIIFANKTKNRDRGFGDVSKLEIEGNVNHRVKMDLDLSELSVGAQREVFALLKKQERTQQQLEEHNLHNGTSLQIPHFKDKT